MNTGTIILMIFTALVFTAGNIAFSVLYFRQQNRRLADQRKRDRRRFKQLSGDLKSSVESYIRQSEEKVTGAIEMHEKRLQQVAKVVFEMQNGKKDDKNRLNFLSKEAREARYIEKNQLQNQAKVG